MNQDMIFVPMAAMALLTFSILLLVPIARFRAVFAGHVTADDFKLGESASVPPNVTLPNRNYMNLLELPTLFFPVCLMLYVAHRVDAVTLGLAWVFVLLRLVHSLIHVSYNNVRHRLVAFTLGNLALGALWIVFFVKDA
jgi:hypothetical protein